MTRKCLIVGPAWVGDMVMAQALFKVLKGREPAREIHVLAPGWSLPLLERMPEVAAGIEMPIGHGELELRARWALGKRLAADGFAQAIVLPRSLKAALVPWFARIPVRTGFRGEWRYGLINDVRPFDPARLDRTVLRFVALGLERGERALPEVPEPALTTDRANALRLLGVGGTEAPQAVALMPGAEYGAAKRWPAARFGELAAQLAELGFEVWILGSAKEAGLAAEIAAGAPRASLRDFAGRTSLTDAADLLALARVAVTNDSGLLHVAAAVGTHVVAIYGSSSPQLTPPLTARASVLYRALACSPCFARECPLGHLDCLKGVGVASVLEAVQSTAGDRAC